MKKILFLLLIVATMATHAQPPAPVKDLTTVNTARPKKGQKMAFEAAWKGHVAKFHKEAKTSVYEILTGPHAGSYHIVSSGGSYADFDNQRPDAAAHNLDLDKTFFPYLEETMNATYRFVDSCSWQPEVVAESFVVTINYLKAGTAGDYRRENSRGVKLNKLYAPPMMSNFSNHYYEQLWAGTDPVVITINRLKDGFKSLQARFYGPPAAPVAGNPSFRDRYTKDYGYDAWDARVKVMDSSVVKREVYLMKLRKDLSSQ